MPRQPRDTRTYNLKKGNKVVYKGITNDPERRAAEHRREGKDFDRLALTSPPLTRRRAKEREAEALDVYRRNHRGRNPRYNDDSDG